MSATASILDDGAPATTDIDVVLTLGGLPAGAAVRAYQRVFSASAVESRGEGREEPPTRPGPRYCGCVIRWGCAARAGRPRIRCPRRPYCTWTSSS